MSDENDLDFPSLVLHEQSRLCLPSRPECIGAAADFLCKRAIACGACPEKRANKVTMSLHEALSNAIVHGNLELSSALKERGDSSFAEMLARRAADPHLAQRKVDIVFEYSGNSCRWVVTDEGPGFDFEHILGGQASDDPEVMLSSGRGILIMRSFMDGVAYDQGGRRLILTMQCNQERRSGDRLPANHLIEVAPMRDDGSTDWNAAFKTVATNLSEHGIALVHEKLVTGERIMISLQSGGRAVTIPAEIRHARSLSGVLMELGCRFLTSETASDTAAGEEKTAAIHAVIDQLLSQCRHEPMTGHERREHQRETFADTIEVLYGTASAIGFTRNISQGGVGFVTSVALPQDVIIVFPARAQLPGVRVHSQIVRSTRIQEDLYDVGARFMELINDT